jgi:hypothetical protein
MLNELRDGHVNLFSQFNISRYDITMLGPVNINTRIIKENYLGSDYYSTGPFAHNFIHNDSIGYIRYGSFSNSIITNYELDFLLERYKGTKGLIIDIQMEVDMLIMYLTYCLYSLMMKGRFIKLK